MEEIIIGNEEEQTAKFEDDYRIVQKKTNKDTVLYVSIIGDYFSAFPLIKTLEDAGSKDTIYLNINSDGGDLYTALSIVNAIKRCKGKTVAVCDSAASAATIITLACDEVHITPLTEFMIHSVTSGSYGNSKENKQLQQHQDTYFTDIMVKSYYGFMPKSEVIALVDNADTLWLYGDELEKRFQNWVKVTGKKVKIY